MCGITGIWNLNNKLLQRDSLIRFTDSLSDRGPDGAGYELLENASLGLGHRRLSILDLSEGGKQPMSYAEGRFWITYNGEIYNFLEIRRELELQSYKFRTISDTEVLLAAYHFWGQSCLEKFNGMFAFVIWDNEKKSLFIARDRFGVKPLHYFFIPNEIFAFASETYSFRFLKEHERRFNNKNLSVSLINPDFLEGSGHTIFQNIFQILPGHYLELTTDTKEIKQQKWWETIDSLRSVPNSYQEQVDDFFTLFEDACRIRLRSDVPVASALSGGLDSSAIYCIVNNLLTKGVKDERISSAVQRAFIAYFPNTPNDERAYAEEVIRYTGGNASFIEPDYSKILTEITTTTERFDAIAGTPIVCATDVYKAMSHAGFRVSIDGHGADEMLYGYKQMVFNAYQTAVLEGSEVEEKDMLNTYSDLCFPNFRLDERNNLKTYGDRIRPSLKKKIALKILPGYFARRDGKNLYSSFMEDFRDTDWVNSFSDMSLPSLSDKHFKNYRSGNAERDTYNLFHYTSLPINLRDFDRASMQNSVEIRSPFMDYRLVSYVFSLPIQSKVGNGFTKRILRDSMINNMPKTIRTRKLKIGLSAPLASWFNTYLKEYINDIVSSNHFQASSIWDGKAIKSLVEARRISGWESFDECAKVWKYLSADLLIKSNNNGT